jgi:23S rRNA (adenine2030-N6)-methyltransferase
MSEQKYANEALPPSYRHDFHAGNIGDVWKHCTLCCLLRELVREESPLLMLDCHAGSGAYELGASGEWTEGIGRLLQAEQGGLPGVVQDYLERTRRGGLQAESRIYSGSPLLSMACLRAFDRLVCYETDRDACGRLRGRVAGDARVEVKGADGMAGMVERCRDSGIRLAALIDPPWAAKQDWLQVPARLLEAWQASPSACFLLWYPIKSYTRVAAMQQRLRAAPLPFMCLELITTPLEYRRQRLNGSGVLLVNAPRRVAAEMSQAACALGEVCAVIPGQWQLRVVSWG